MSKKENKEVFITNMNRALKDMLSMDVSINRLLLFRTS